MFLKSFCRSQLLYKSFNLSFTATNVENKSTDLCGNWLGQDDLKDTLCEIRVGDRARIRAETEQLETFQGPFSERQVHNQALTVLFEPYSLDSGGL